jgi:UDP-N-acetylmuramyl pentapeptide synthase
MAHKVGFPNSKIIEVEDVQTAIKVMKKRLTGEDVVLIKGSRGMGMDIIVPNLEMHL